MPEIEEENVRDSSGQEYYAVNSRGKMMLMHLKPGHDLRGFVENFGSDDAWVIGGKNRPTFVICGPDLLRQEMKPVLNTAAREHRTVRIDSSGLVTPNPRGRVVLYKDGDMVAALPAAENLKHTGGITASGPAGDKRFLLPSVTIEYKQVALRERELPELVQREVVNAMRTGDNIKTGRSTPLGSFFAVRQGRIEGIKKGIARVFGRGAR